MEWYLLTRSIDESHVSDMNIQRRRNGLSPYFFSFRHYLALLVHGPGFVLLSRFHVASCLGLERW